MEEIKEKTLSVSMRKKEGSNIKYFYIKWKFIRKFDTTSLFKLKCIRK